MSTAYTFQGRLIFASPTDRATALAAVRALFADEDADLSAQVFEDWDALFRPDGPLDLQVEIDGSGPSDWWFAFEGAVELLCEQAVAGVVESTDEDGGVDRYAADP